MKQRPINCATQRTGNLSHRRKESTNVTRLYTKTKRKTQLKFNHLQELRKGLFSQISTPSMMVLTMHNCFMTDMFSILLKYFFKISILCVYVSVRIVVLCSYLVFEIWPVLTIGDREGRKSENWPGHFDMVVYYMCIKLAIMNKFINVYYNNKAIITLPLNKASINEFIPNWCHSCCNQS